MLPNFATSLYNTRTTGAKWWGRSRTLADRVTVKAIQDSKHKIKPSGWFSLNPVCWNYQLYCNDCYLRFKCKRANQRENFLSFEETTGSYVFPWALSYLLFLRVPVIGSWAQILFKEAVQWVPATQERVVGLGTWRGLYPEIGTLTLVCIDPGETSNTSWKTGYRVKASPLNRLWSASWLRLHLHHQLISISNDKTLMWFIM